MAVTFNDPLFASQWYLKNTGQRGGTSRLDVNIMSAWESVTGKGVVVAINDDGMDLSHPDLAANILASKVYDTVRGTTGQGFQNTDNSHGTVVGSIVGMVANDGIGGVGVAYDAKLVPSLAIAANVNTAALFLSNLTAGADVSVNSWGQDPAFAENFGASGTTEDRAWSAAMLRAATEGRNGLGMVIEVSGGNERGNRADTALSNFTGNKLTIAVGALTETGAPTDYSTPGASLLVSAPGGVASADQSVNQGFGIVSADIQSNAGYNTTAGAAGDYAYQSQGTSYSGPIVGGAVALMLQANPKLGFRDVSTILAMTARKVDATNPNWVKNAAGDWNLGGMHFSRDAGYGLVDISAAVRLAESWYQPAGTVANWKSVQGVSTNGTGTVPDASTTGLTVSASVANSVRIERMEFDLNLTANSPSQLMAEVTSPGGTKVVLFDQPLTRPLSNGAPDMNVAETAWPATFTIGSTAFLGESSAGTWTLKLTDKVTGEVATFNSFTVRAWGSDISNDSQYVFTDEFNGASTLLSDAAGTDTLNAAAVQTAVSLNLNAGQTSNVAGGNFVIGANTQIENAIGGLGDDTLTGNALSNVLRGNRGNDTLNGGAGIDTAVYSGNRADYTFNFASGNTITTTKTLEGTDTLTGIERLQFADRKVALDVSSGANGATAAQFLGTVAFPLLANKSIAGVILNAVDLIGGGLKGIFDVAVNGGLTAQLAGGADNVSLAKLVFRNVVGSEASDATANALASLIQGSGGPLSQSDFLSAVARLDINLQHVGLVGTSGLQATGLEYA